VEAQSLDLADNKLTALPMELGNLQILQTLKLDRNPLTVPPPDVVAQGTQAVLEYLRKLGEEPSRR
jgi:Leucine-rich repeat (LRR) protein